MVKFVVDIPHREYQKIIETALQNKESLHAVVKAALLFGLKNLAPRRVKVNKYPKKK
jgi:hypothetical protein